MPSFEIPVDNFTLLGLYKIVMIARNDLPQEKLAVKSASIFTIYLPKSRAIDL